MSKTTAVQKVLVITGSVAVLCLWGAVLVGIYFGELPIGALVLLVACTVVAAVQQQVQRRKKLEEGLDDSKHH